MGLTGGRAEPHPLGVAVLGFWHVHADEYANAAAAHPGTRLVAVWDHLEGRGRAAAQHRRVPFVADLAELLARPDVDAVIVTNETVAHTQVIGDAIAAGKHVLSEKLLAPTTGDVAAILDAASRSGVQVVTSLPYLSQSPALTALAQVAEGRLGRVHYVRVRVAHDGATRGWLAPWFFDPDAAVGGAMTDLGCHPAYLMLAFMGREPDTVHATYGRVTGRAVEDLASTTATFPGGGVGVAETSFVDPGCYDYQVTGDGGAIAYSSRDDTVWGRGPGFPGEGWSPIPQVAAEARPFDRWIKGIQTSTADPANLEAARTLTGYIVASNLSAATGRPARYRVSR